MANVKEWIIVVHPNGKENKGQTKGEAFKSFVESKTGKDYRQNTSYEEITAKTKELENKYNSELPFAGGILDKKEYVEEYSFSGSKFTNEEADIYYLKDGHKIIFQAMGDTYYQKITPQQALRVWNKIPDYLKRSHIK